MHGEHYVIPAFAVKKERDQITAPEADSDYRTGNNQRADAQLEPEGVFYTLIVAAAVKLGGEYSRSRHGTEKGKIGDKIDLIDDGNAVHLMSAELSDH